MSEADKKAANEPDKKAVLHPVAVSPRASSTSLLTPKPSPNATRTLSSPCPPKNPKTLDLPPHLVAHTASKPWKTPPSVTRGTDQRPVYQLSVHLIQLYKAINERFYRQKRKTLAESKGEQYNDGYDDEHGNYIVQVKEEIFGRYIVQELLGKGSFGVVMRAHDNQRNVATALKVIKNKRQFFQQAKVEIEILLRLCANAAEEHNIVTLKKYFTWKNHLVLAFELLSFNLYDVIKYTRFTGVSLTLIRKFASQLLHTLEFLSSPNIRIVHCDLKPENILLKNPKRSAIKVIDFGSSCYETKRMYKYVQSRFYRSPEVILHQDYGCPVDMWSLGCILVELHCGVPLLDGKNEGEQLEKMVEVFGDFPPDMLQRSSAHRLQTLFNKKSTENGDEKWVVKSLKRHNDESRPQRTLESILMSDKGPMGRRQKEAGHSPDDYRVFISLVSRMLEYDPNRRITPTEALRHEYFKDTTAATPTNETVEIPSSEAMLGGNSHVEETEHGKGVAGSSVWFTYRAPAKGTYSLTFHYISPSTPDIQIAVNNVALTTPPWTPSKATPATFSIDAPLESGRNIIAVLKSNGDPPQLFKLTVTPPPS